MSTHELFYKNATNIVGKLQEIDVFFSDHDYKFTGVIETLLRGEGYSWQRYITKFVAPTTYTEEADSSPLYAANNKTCHGDGAWVTASDTYNIKRIMDRETLEIMWTQTRLMNQFKNLAGLKFLLRQVYEPFTENQS